MRFCFFDWLWFSRAFLRAVELNEVRVLLFFALAKHESSSAEDKGDIVLCPRNHICLCCFPFFSMLLLLPRSPGNCLSLSVAAFVLRLSFHNQANILG